MFGDIELTSGWDGTTHVLTDIMAFMRGMWFAFVRFTNVGRRSIDGVRYARFLVLAKGLTDFRKVHEHG